MEKMELVESGVDCYENIESPLRDGSEAMDDNIKLSKREKYMVALKLLKKNYPVFFKFKPLKIGIQKDIFNRHPDITRHIIRSVLWWHTHDFRYLKSIAIEEYRYDLDGNPVVPITLEHRQYAKDCFEERVKNQSYHKTGSN